MLYYKTCRCIVYLRVVCCRYCSGLTAQPANFREKVDAEPLTGDLAALLSQGKTSKKHPMRGRESFKSSSLRNEEIVRSFKRRCGHQRKFETVGKRFQKESDGSGKFLIKRSQDGYDPAPGGEQVRKRITGRTSERQEKAKQLSFGITRSAGWTLLSRGSSSGEGET